MEISIRWNICRVCLVEEQKKENSTMLHIFGEDKMLVQHIHEFSGVSMNPNDNLPDKICRKCMAFLKCAVNFRKSCRESNDYLLSIIQRTKSASSLFRPERKTDSSMDIFTEDTNFHYMVDDDDTFSLEKCDVKREETEKKVNSNDTQKRKESVKSIQNVKEMKLIESKTNDSFRNESNYVMKECDGREYEENEDIIDPIIIEEDDDIDEGEIEKEVEENADEIMENDDDYMKEQEQSSNKQDNNSNRSAEEDDKYMEKSKKVMKTNLQNTTLHYNKRRKQALILDTNYDKQEAENENDENCSEKPNYTDTMEHGKLEETDSNLYFILNRENKLNDDVHQVNVEDENEFVSSDDNVDFMPLEEEMEDSQHYEDNDNNDEEVEALSSHVTSTTMPVKDEIYIEDNSSNMSHITQDIEAEYVIDDYVFNEQEDSNSSNMLHSKVTANTKTSKRKSVFSLVPKSNRQITRSKSVFEVGGRKKVATSSTSSHSAEEQFFTCELCGNIFSNRQLLNAHMKVHRQEKTHECEICFKRFITACNLQAHMRIHTGEKPFECNFCGRRFSDRSTQLRHQRIHTNEKPFTCEHCGKSFSLATSLHAHLKVHSSERPHRCEPCAKSFKLPHQLKAHQNTHLHRAVEQSASL